MQGKIIYGFLYEGDDFPSGAEEIENIVKKSKRKYSWLGGNLITEI